MTPDGALRMYASTLCPSDGDPIIDSHTKKDGPKVITTRERNAIWDLICFLGANDARSLTNEAKRPRLHRDDERSRDSEMLRESGRQCRRGPT